MIRYVKIGAEYEVRGDKDCFAFINTVDDRFIEICGDHVFDSADDLKEAFACDRLKHPALEQRLLGLIPKGEK